MTEIIIVLSPSFDRRGKRRHDRFDVRINGSSEVICDATRQPLLDAGRVLLARGFDPATIVCMVHRNAPTVVSMREPIGVAAQFDVRGEKFVRRKLPQGPMPRPGLRINGSARASTTPSATSSPASTTSTPPSPSTS